MNNEIKEFGLGLIGILILFIGAALLGEAFRAYTLFFVALWILVPVFACLFLRASVRDSFTLSGLRRIRTLLMTLVVGVSFAMFACRDDVRNRFGKQYVQDYSYWLAEPEEDDDGRPYYPGDHWTAKTSSGRWAITLLNWIIYASIIGLPTITWKASSAAINKKQSECRFMEDANQVETHEASGWTMADVDSDEFRLGVPHVWTEVHHTDGGGSSQRMQLGDGSVVFLSVGLTTVKVFVTPLQLTNQTEFRELREFALTNVLERHAFMTPAERYTEDLLLLNNLRRAIAWPKSVDELSATLNGMNDTLQTKANA